VFDRVAYTVQGTAAVAKKSHHGVLFESGTWIDGQDKYTAITIAPGNEVVIESIGFTNCNGYAGSAIFNMGVLLMLNVELYRNQADYGQFRPRETCRSIGPSHLLTRPGQIAKSGGAIYNDGILKLEHLTADANAGRRCGSVLYSSLGEPPGKCDVKSSSFTNNFQVRLRLAWPAQITLCRL
jgi:hypothetical protein